MKARNVSIVGLILSSFLLVYLVSESLNSKYLSLYVFAIGFAAAVQIGCWLFLLRQKTQVTLATRPRPGTTKLVSSAFFVLLGLVILELHNSVVILSTLYFLLLAMLAAVTAIRIVMAESKKEMNLTLGMVMVVAAFTSFSFYRLNPYPYASDVAFLYHGIRSVIESGRLPHTAGWYFFYPMFVAYDSTAIIASGFPVFQFGTVNSWVMFSSTIFLYLATKEFFGAKVALLAALLFASTNLFVRITAGTLGLGLFIYALYPALMIMRSKGPAWHVVFWVNAVVILLVHPAASMAFLAFLGGVRLTRGVVPRQSLLPSPRKTYFLAFSVAFAGYSIYIVYPFFARLVEALFLRESTVGTATTTWASGTVPPELLLQLVFGYLSIFLLACLGTLGFLWVMEKGAIHQRSVNIVTVLLVLPPVASLATNNFNLEPTRALQFLMTILTILGALGLWRLAKPGSVESRSRGALLVAGLVFLASFSGTISYLNGNANHTLSGSVPALSAQTTTATLQARFFVERLPANSQVFADINTMLYILGPADRSTYPSGIINFGLLEPSTVSRFNETYYILSSFGLNSGSYTQSGAVILGSDFADRTGMNVSPLFSVVYQNGDVAVYVKARG